MIYCQNCGNYSNLKEKNDYVTCPECKERWRKGNRADEVDSLELPRKKAKNSCKMADRVKAAPLSKDENEWFDKKSLYPVIALLVGGGFMLLLFMLDRSPVLNEDPSAKILVFITLTFVFLIIKVVITEYNKK